MTPRAKKQPGHEKDKEVSLSGHEGGAPCEKDQALDELFCAIDLNSAYLNYFFLTLAAALQVKQRYNNSITATRSF